MTHPGPSRIAVLVVAFCVAATAPPSGAQPQTQTGPPSARPDATAEALAAGAYEAAFNLDYDRALADARRLVALEPNRSSSYRVLSGVLWADILFRTGMVTVDHFLGGFTKSMDTRPKVPADLTREFTTAVDRAIALAEAAVTQAPRSVEARYDLGAAYAIQASYQASIEGSVMAAFGPARKAFSAQEAVLDRSPSHPNANVVAGTYRYSVSELRFPSRWMAYLAGFAGGKERGIGMIESVASAPGAEFDALPALLLIYNYEQRYDDALKVIERLARTFPRNRLFTLETGATLLRARRARDAERVIARGLATLDADPRPKAPGERALWLYKHAAALNELGRAAEASSALDVALRHDPAGWVRGRIHLERGKAADLAGRRADAVESYRQARAIASSDNDPAARRAAQALISAPFRPKSTQ